MRECDVAIIGAGVAGCATARECARFAMKTAVFEAGLDVADGATRANSGIVHAGYDPKPGTRKARYNVAGAKLYPQWAHELGFPYKQNGSLVIAFSDDELSALHELLSRGQQNGVEGLRVIDAPELRELEPNVSPEAKGALLVSTGGICDPYQVAFRSAENAARNGVEFNFESRVIGVSRAEGEGYILHIEDHAGVRAEDVHARTVVNAAGVHADEVHDMVAPHAFSITARRGEYNLMDTDMGGLFTHTMFQAPTKAGKGVLVTPTVHGNLLVGPNAHAQKNKDATATTAEGLAEITEAARKTYPGLSMRGRITTFAGVRATGDTGDFEIGEVSQAPGFFDIACFESPGLTSAPAVASDMAARIAKRLGATENAQFNPMLDMPKLFKHMNKEERSQAISANPSAGHIMCRCCEVSQADVTAALSTTLPVLCLDALKWRTNAMMGRCHGGFCTPELSKVIAREAGVRPSDMPKRLAGSHIVAASPENYAELAADEAAGHESAECSCSGSYDVAVIGGGAAGIAAAASAAREGASVVLIDREGMQGGILKQCIHNGFGLHRFGEELTGPEYASRELASLSELAVDVVRDASVLSVARNDGSARDVSIEVVSPAGEMSISAGAAVLATGSRERGAGALGTPGTRPAGVFSAGSAQNFMNLQGCAPGRKAVILGSGDIGLIMARRLTFAGAHVAGVFEINSTPSGLRRNIVQCLDDFGIPLYTSTTVVGIEGESQLTAVVVSEVNERYEPIAGTERRIECDTLLLSVGLIPENAIAQQAGVQLDPMTGGAIVDDCFETSVPGVFACGNALHIHDLVDFVSDEGDHAGRAAAKRAFARAEGFALQDEPASREGSIPTRAGEGVRYIVPQFVHPETDRATLRFRTSASFENASIIVEKRMASGEIELVKRRRVLVAVPAEMQSVELNGNAFCGASEVVVRIEPHNVEGKAASHGE